MQQVDGAVENLLSDILQIPASQISENLTMKEVDAWDSLKHMELIVSLEQSFGIELSFDEIVAMQSVSEIKRVLREKGAVS
jgi:acyl carrier protein